MRNTEKSINAINWFEKHFLDYGDSSPTENQIHLDLCDKIDIWAIYRNEMKTFYGPDSHYDYTTWLQIWKTAFSYVKIRVYKQVNGKCWTCYYINEGRAKSTSKKELAAYRELHQLHKMGNFMLERRKYKNRRDHALQHENCNTVCSIIIDGMDQNHSLLPNFGPNQVCNEAIPIHVTGILQHSNSYGGVNSGPAGSKIGQFISCICNFKFCRHIVTLIFV